MIKGFRDFILRGYVIELAVAVVIGTAFTAIVNVIGHGREGKALDYKQVRCIILAKRGMLALNVEWSGMGQFKNRMGHYHLAQLDLHRKNVPILQQLGRSALSLLHG